MHRFMTATPRAVSGRFATALIIFAVLLANIPFVAQPVEVQAHHTNMKWPFAAGSTWYISQGYNTSPSEGWSHYNCDSTTLKDAISQTTSCNQHYQYKYSFDLKRLDGNTAGQSLLSPANGTIRWIDQAFGGLSINLGDGYAVAFFHATLAPGLAAGQQVTQGQVLGTVAPAGQGGNGGTPHIHLTVWQTTDGGNWSRVAVPFTGNLSIDGYDYPALSDSTRNQHYQKQITSTNLATGSSTGASTPTTPSPVSPATGTTYTTTGVTPTLTWSSVSGATHYQVVVNNGSIISPWLTTTSWTMSSLATGQYAWQVRAKNASGESSLSAKWVFWVDPPGGTNPTPTPTPGPTGTPGPLGLTLSRTSASFGVDVQANGSGYNPNETVNIYLDSTSTSPIATVTAAGNGSFARTFPMPEMTGGNHTIIARGVSSSKQSSATIRMSSTLTRTPYQGPPGTTVSVTVFGFGANETVRLNSISESGPLLGNATTNAKGTGTVSVKIPDAPNGWHDYVGAGLTSGFRAYGALFVERSVALSPASGNPGTSVTVTAKGFPAQESITVGWNRTSTVAGTTVCSGTSNASGNYSCSFQVPQTGAGGYPVMVRSSSGASSSATFGVLGPAAVSINPSSGSVGSNLTVNGGGFNANEQVRLHWNSSSSAWTTVTADSTGSIFRPATVPNLSIATHTLNARGLTSNKSASTTFRVTATGGATGTSMISPGTYRITATIEGLVGHTTSNGHKIVPFDRFVALPACTQSSCPWLTPGNPTTYVAPCGNNCFVRVLNPATGLCAVAPVWDRGPWFINDNWWEPADKRYLNTRPGAVNYLAQGYTGADAARNGLDVGFGLSNGIGISDVGYQTGNRAAMDIADGTWVDIGFRQSAGIGEVIVTMLWQTGEHHATAAAGCGQGSNTPTPTPTPVPSGPLAISLSPANGPVGTKVQVTGTGYAAGETVNVYLDSSSTPALASVKATSAGAISAQITIPSTAAGAHRIHAVGQTSKTRTAATYSVTETTAPLSPSIALNPNSGSIGTTIQVTGSGYLGGETVRVHLDSSSNPALVTVTASNSGAISAQFKIPNTTEGDHRIHVVGQSSKARTAATLVVKPKLAVTLNPTSGLAGTRVQVTGTGYGANEAVKVYLDTASGPGLATVNTTSAGAFSAQITIPSSATVGSHRIHAVGQTSKVRTAATFVVGSSSASTLNPAISLNSVIGPVGTTVQVTGAGYGPNETIRVYLDSSTTPALASVTSTSNGAFTAQIVIPGTVGGAHRIHAVGQTTKLRTAQTFTVSASVSPSATAGNARHTITYTARGFAGNETVNLYWNGSSTAEATATTDASGNAILKAQAPWPAGTHIALIRGSTSTSEASVNFTVRANVRLTPTTGNGTARIDVRGTGFPAATNVNIFWNTATSANLLCSVRTSSLNGTFDCNVLPPVGATAGTYTIIAIGGGSSATAAYTLTSAVTRSAEVIETIEIVDESIDEPVIDETQEPEIATPEPSVDSEEPTKEQSDPEPEIETPGSGDDQLAEGSPADQTSSEENVDESPADADEGSIEDVIEEDLVEPNLDESPEPVAREIVLYPIADTSVSSETPDQPLSPESITSLTMGGEPGNISLITFAVEGVTAGSVVSATLVLTGSGAFGAAGGNVQAIAGYMVDEAGLTYDTIPMFEFAAAVGTDGEIASIAWLEPGVETTIDVTGTVQSDGTITFVLAGLPDSSVSGGSRESGTPPRLIITILEPATAP